MLGNFGESFCIAVKGVTFSESKMKQNNKPKPKTKVGKVCRPEYGLWESKVIFLPLAHRKWYTVTRSTGVSWIWGLKAWPSAAGGGEDLARYRPGCSCPSPIGFRRKGILVYEGGLKAEQAGSGSGGLHWGIPSLPRTCVRTG